MSVGALASTSVVSFPSEEEPQSMSNSPAVTDATFEQEVIQSETPVLVDFWAEWCGPCKMMAPVLDQVAVEQASKLKIVKVDVDENSEYAGRLGIMSIPTLILFKEGQPVERIVGFAPKDQLIRKLNPHL
jgi:thioredoxin 1